MNIIRKKYKFLLALFTLALLTVIVPAGNASAASVIEVTGFTQGMKSVTLKWNPVRGASAYIIARRSADGKTGRIDYSSTKKMRQNSCTLNDTNISLTDQGKTFLYYIYAVDSRGNKLASVMKYLVKLPTTSITAVKSTIDGSVTLAWEHYDTVDSYRVQWAEVRNGSLINLKGASIAKKHQTVTIRNLKPKTEYVFDIKAEGSGYYGNYKIKSLGWRGRATVKMPHAAKLVLHYNNGDVYREIPLDPGSSYTLPSMPNPEGYTFIGWGFIKNVFISEKGIYRIPYEAYSEAKNIRGTVNLYAILSDRSREKDLSEAQMFSPDISKYKKVIFIGDSRTRYQQYMLETMHIDPETKNIAYVSKPGAGLDWLEKDGYSQTIQKINEINSSSPEDTRPIALVFNVGVNNVQHNPTSIAARYIDFYKSIVPELKEKGCKLFLMSVNPVVSEQIRVYFHSTKEEWRVRTFNQNLSKALQGSYTYLDTYSWLISTGFGTDSGIRTDSGMDDGAHYTSKTYKRILWKALSLLAAAG